MESIGARLRQVARGDVEIQAPVREDLSQQHGYLYAGVVTALLDSVCGYSVLTLSPRGTDVITMEFKVNFLSPASGTVVIARGRVVRAGRSITVCGRGGRDRRQPGDHGRHDAHQYADRGRRALNGLRRTSGAPLAPTLRFGRVIARELFRGAHG
jgi:uncharacterized protein (TIGR00369 family)